VWRAAILSAAAATIPYRLPAKRLPYSKAQSDVRPEESHHRDRPVGGDPAWLPAAGRGAEAGAPAPAAGGAAERAAGQRAAAVAGSGGNHCAAAAAQPGAAGG